MGELKDVKLIRDDLGELVAHCDLCGKDVQLVVQNLMEIAQFRYYDEYGQICGYCAYQQARLNDLNSSVSDDL